MILLVLNGSKFSKQLYSENSYVRNKSMCSIKTKLYSVTLTPTELMFPLAGYYVTLQILYATLTIFHPYPYPQP